MAKKIGAILVTFCILNSTLADIRGETPAETEIVDEARKRAENYLWDQTDDITGLWPQFEVTSGILGVIGEIVTLNGGLHNYKSQNETSLILRNMERFHLDFFINLHRAGGDLAEMADEDIAQAASLLRMSCVKNPSDYFGLDLISEIEDRVTTTYSMIGTGSEEPPLSFPVFMMILCHNKNYNLINEKGIQVLDLMGIKHQKNGEKHPLGVERAALNAMALRCLQEPFGAHTEIKKKLFNLSIRNLKYIYSMQETDGGYGTVYTTSLAVQADLSRMVNPPNSQFNFKKARQWLMAAQKEDGSFGSSVTFTSLAIGGLTSRSIDRVKQIECEQVWKMSKNNFEIKVIFEDSVFAQQKFIQRLPAKKGDKLFALLSQFSKENPLTFDLELTQNENLMTITRVNELMNIPEADNSWKVYKEKNGAKVSQVFNLANEIVDPEFGYWIEYS